MFFDSHCHLDHPLLRPRLPALIAAAAAAGVAGFLIPGVDPRDWQGISDLAGAYPCIYPAFGVHPLHASLLTPDMLFRLGELGSGAVAIGEIGLDYALPSPSREFQQHAFRVQLHLAAEVALPVLIHCRRAFGDLLAILREQRNGPIRGVMHAFSGSPETADACLGLGLHISFAGSVTYHNARRPLEAAARVPLDRLLLETDAPDLAPEPHRGSVNLPAYLTSTADRVARIRGIPLAELARATTANATRLFRLDSPGTLAPGSRA